MYRTVPIRIRKMMPTQPDRDPRSGFNVLINLWEVIDNCALKSRLDKKKNFQIFYVSTFFLLLSTHYPLFLYDYVPCTGIVTVDCYN
jgi:hypothetical protein